MTHPLLPRCYPHACLGFYTMVKLCSLCLICNLFNYRIITKRTYLPILKTWIFSCCILIDALVILLITNNGYLIQILAPNLHCWGWFFHGKFSFRVFHYWLMHCIYVCNDGILHLTQDWCDLIIECCNDLDELFRFDKVQMRLLLWISIGIFTSI
jgi:hypothetical protein